MMGKTDKAQSLLQSLGADPKDSTRNLSKFIQDKFEEAQEKHNEKIYRLIGAGLELRPRYEILEEWEILYKDPRWLDREAKNRPGPDADEREITNTMSHKFYGGRNDVNGDRASKYSRVIHFFYERSKSPQDLVAALRRDGFEKTLLAIREMDPLKSSKPDRAATKGSEDDRGNTRQSSKERDKNSNGAGTAGKNDSTNASTKSHQLKLERDVVIVVDDETMRDAIYNDPECHRVKIYATVEKEQDGKWREIRAEKVKAL